MWGIGPSFDMEKMSVRSCVCTFYLIVVASAFVSAKYLDIKTVIIWSPSESQFFANDTTMGTYQDLQTSYDFTVLQDGSVAQYFIDKRQHPSVSWTIVVDLREYACPVEVFQERVLAYISVTQMHCLKPITAVNGVEPIYLSTRVFDRRVLVAHLTNATQRASDSLALLFDHTGEEHFYERTWPAGLPLMFEISMALHKCAATEQLKNLTAKTEIRNVVVVARARCISELLTEASSLKLLFGRYRWLLYPTDGDIPRCDGCSLINGIIVRQHNRSEDLPDARLGKLIQLVNASLTGIEGKLTTEDLNDCNNVSYACHQLPQQVALVLTQNIQNSTAVFYTHNDSAREDIVFDLFMMSDNKSTYVDRWSQAGGFKHSAVNRDLFPHSKSDIVLRAVVIVEPPFVFRTETPNGPEYSGYSLDVLEKISEIVGFGFVVRQCDNNDYGILKESSEWSGCIGNIIRGEADVIVGALTVTAEREEVVDFTLPYYDFAGIQILMRKPDTDVNLFYFVDVFTTEAWLCLLGVIALTSCLLFVFERFSPRTGVDKGQTGARQEDGGDGSEVAKAFDLKDSIWFVVGSVTLAGGGEPPRCLASRLLVAGFWFFSVVVMSTFTANLAAFLTVSRMGTTIASLDELSAQSDVKYSVVAESNVMAYFEHQAAIERNFYELWKNMSLGSTSVNTGTEQSLAVWDYPLGDKFGNMWNTMKATGLLNSTHDGVEKVLHDNFALITESPVIKYYTAQNCMLTSVGDQFSVRPYAFALKEKSLFTTKFTDAILTLQKQRILESLKRKWWEDNKVACPVESRDQGLDLSSLTGTFVVMGGGLCLGIVVLLVECLISRRTSRKRKAMIAEKVADVSKPVSTVESAATTLDQLMMARELKNNLERRQYI